MKWTTKANKYLKKYWNIDSLKDKQFDVINELLSGNDVIGLLPTGYGKSMCYLIPPLVSKKVMFIISPLISLMDDQKHKLTQMGIKCAALHSNNNNIFEETEMILAGEIKIVYMSPEYLIKSNGLSLAESLKEIGLLGFLAVDESHCCSVWGQDFRPEYTKIKEFRERIPEIPILAVTATATKIVCDDISMILCLNDPVLVKTSFDRPNLFIKVEELMSVQIGKSKKSKKMTIVQKVTDLVIPKIKEYDNMKIIIYVNSRKDTEEFAATINSIIPFVSDAYHAGMGKKARETIQSKFANGEIKVIVSTIAFGMGIDQTVKCVLVFGCPSSIEEYYQQIGRGGRDGMPCDTVLYFDYGKLAIAKFMLKDVKHIPTLYKVKLENLNKIGKFAYYSMCRRKYILEHFNEVCDFFTCNNCDNCCNQKLTDITAQVWPILFKTNMNITGMTNMIRNTLLSQDLDIIGPISYWRKYITENNITLENIPEKLKIKIPTNFLSIKKSPEKKPETDFEEKLNLYEKIAKKQINL